MIYGLILNDNKEYIKRIYGLDINDILAKCITKEKVLILASWPTIVQY